MQPSKTTLYEGTLGTAVDTNVQLNDSIANYRYIEVILNINQTENASGSRSSIILPRQSTQFIPIWVGGRSGTTTYGRFVFYSDSNQFKLQDCGLDVYLWQVNGYK